MTPSPLPPPGRQLAVSTVMAGQTLVDTRTGAETIATQDLVLLTALNGGTETETWPLSPELAMTLARGLSTACGALISHEVDDTGKPLPLLARLARFGRL